MINKKSFTLVEILIVIGIIALMAAIAIPSLLRARIIANQAGAVTVLKNIMTACNIYAVKNDSFPIADDGGLEILAEANPPYIGNKIAQATSPASALKGYYYVYNSDSSGFEFTLQGRPAYYGFTGLRSFISDPKGVIRYRDENAAADLTDPALE